MKSLRFIPAILILLLCSFLSSCAVVGGIFKAGFWSGIILVAIVIGIIIFVIAKMSGSGKN